MVSLEAASRGGFEIGLRSRAGMNASSALIVLIPYKPFENALRE
jgi:hypothetical protein